MCLLYIYILFSKGNNFTTANRSMLSSGFKPHCLQFCMARVGLILLGLVVYLLPHLFPFYFSLSFIGFAYFLLLSIPSLSTRIVPLRFQAGGRRRRPNLCLACVLLCNLCYLYFLVKMDCGVLFYLV